MAKQNEKLNVSSWKLTTSKKDEVKTLLILQIMIEATEFKALVALEYLWRPFYSLKKAHCVRLSQGDGDEVNHESIETAENTGERR